MSQLLGTVCPTLAANQALYCPHIKLLLPVENHPLGLSFSTQNRIENAWDRKLFPTNRRPR